MEIKLNRLARALLAAVGASTLLVLVPSSPASASNGAVKVEGLLAPDETNHCPLPPPVPDSQLPPPGRVTGSLDGCWYIDSGDVDHVSPSGTMVIRGTEHFDGCLGERCGTFFTTYTFTSKWDGATEDHGRCHHPITGGTDGFAGATGEINMHDLPNGCALYKGTIRFDG